MRLEQLAIQLASDQTVLQVKRGVARVNRVQRLMCFPRWETAQGHLSLRTLAPPLARPMLFGPEHPRCAHDSTPQGQLEAARRDLQDAEARAASAAQSSATNPRLAQYLSVTLQQLQLVTERREAAEGERDRLAAAHARLVQTIERERGERERQAALAQQQVCKLCCVWGMRAASRLCMDRGLVAAGCCCCLG